MSEFFDMSELSFQYRVEVTSKNGIAITDVWRWGGHQDTETWLRYMGKIFKIQIDSQDPVRWLCTCQVDGARYAIKWDSVLKSAVLFKQLSPPPTRLSRKTKRDHDKCFPGHIPGAFR